MKEYYNKCAQEYEKIYYRDNPIRQSELNDIENRINKIFRNKRVLEIACGTGYWTEKITKVASRIVAVDSSKEMLSIAKHKNLLSNKVTFIKDDAYVLDNIKGSYNGGLANFWFSHLPKKLIENFLNVFHSKLEKGSIVFMADNTYVQGVGGELIRKNNDDNTYKIRILNNGNKFEVLKNYYNKDEIEKIFKNLVLINNIHFSNFYWWIEYITKNH